MPWQQGHNKQEMSLSIAVVFRNLCTKYEVVMPSDSKPRTVCLHCHGNKVFMTTSWLGTTVGSNDLCTKYEVISEELQTLKIEMYASVAMVTILPYQQVINLLSLLEGTCLPSMKVKSQSYEGKFLK